VASGKWQEAATGHTPKSGNATPRNAKQIDQSQAESSTYYTI